MKGAEFILQSKGSPFLYVRLTKHRRRFQWEYTEEFKDATYFKDTAEIDSKMELHSVPRGTMRARPYTTAFSEWLNQTPRFPNI